MRIETKWERSNLPPTLHITTNLYCKDQTELDAVKTRVLKVMAHWSAAGHYTPDDNLVITIHFNVLADKTDQEAEAMAERTKQLFATVALLPMDKVDRMCARLARDGTVPQVTQ